MKNVFQNQKSILVVSLLVILVTAAAWQRDDTIKKSTQSKYENSRDTVVPKQRNYDKDELTMKELNNAIIRLNIEMKRLNEEMKNIHLDLSQSLKEAFNGINMEKINSEIEASMKNINFEKINEEVNQSLKDAQIQIEKIDKQKIRDEMELLENKINSGELKKQIEESMKDATLHMERATKELQELKNFTDELQKDGLIDKKKGFTIEWKNGGELYINGIKQSKDISDKYKKYYKGDDYEIKISKDKGEYI